MEEKRIPDKKGQSTKNSLAIQSAPNAGEEEREKEDKNFFRLFRNVFWLRLETLRGGGMVPDVMPVAPIQGQPIVKKEIKVVS